jgi:hypothetical protein
MSPESEAEREKRESKQRERERELDEIPLRPTDKSKWPRGVRPVALGEMDGLGIDRDGRPYWNGKPLEIRQHLDLSKGQAIFAAVMTLIIALATFVQGWTAYHEWACKVDWPTAVACPKPPSVPDGPG